MGQAAQPKGQVPDGLVPRSVRKLPLEAWGQVPDAFGSQNVRKVSFTFRALLAYCVMTSSATLLRSESTGARKHSSVPVTEQSMPMAVVRLLR